MHLISLQSIEQIYNERLTSWAEVMLVHEGEGEGILCVQGALIRITSVHSIHHVSHLLPRVPHRVFALFSKLAAKENTKGSPECGEPWGTSDTRNQVAQSEPKDKATDMYWKTYELFIISGVKTTHKPLHRLVDVAHLIFVRSLKFKLPNNHFFYLGLRSERKKKE